MKLVSNPSFEGGACVPRAIKFKTHDHPLARMHATWGVVFIGTKAELQAAGFGVGAVFPAEPGGHIRKTTLPASNGFLHVDVALYDRPYLGEPSQTGIRNYEVRASYLSEKGNRVRAFTLSPWPGVVLYRAISHDVYKGSMGALIAANLTVFSQFPGQSGCGKVRTTFDRDGQRVIKGSNAANHEGARTVLAAGNQFEIWIRVSDAEREKRHARWCADDDD
ncbi:hypothetical protein [Limnohabitans sp.]|uniref:hypothetical protein n=1 Tax=Limnohabitans sp. TaxID=1907725 RepID=UPI00286F25D3|nr:hypothetical protein [Limnohabitans sp.]